jgi:hypothetical protein
VPELCFERRERPLSSNTQLYLPLSPSLPPSFSLALTPPLPPSPSLSLSLPPFAALSAIGYFAGIVAGVACLVSAAGGAFIKLTGLKWPNMLIGAASFACMAGIFLVVDTENWDKKDLG